LPVLSSIETGITVVLEESKQDYAKLLADVNSNEENKREIEDEIIKGTTQSKILEYVVNATANQKIKKNLVVNRTFVLIRIEN
jgi:hypothetical protein